MLNFEKEGEEINVFLCVRGRGGREDIIYYKYVYCYCRVTIMTENFKFKTLQTLNFNKFIAVGRWGKGKSNKTLGEWI